MMEYYTAVKRNEILVHITTRISDLGNIILSETGQQKREMLCDYTYVILKYQNRQIYRQRKQTGGSQRLKGRGARGG